MAILGDWTKITAISDPLESIKLHNNVNANLLLMLLENKHINVYSYEEKRIIETWSVRSGQKVSSNVVFNPKSECFTAIINNNSLYSWMKHEPDIARYKSHDEHSRC